MLRLVLLIVANWFASCAAENIAVGLLYNKNDVDLERVFNGTETLGFYAEHVSSDDPFETLTSTCNLLESGVVGVFDDTSKISSDVVQSICDALDVPHVITRWYDKKLLRKTMINLYPDPSTLGKVYTDIVLSFGWKKFTAFYEDDEGLSRLGQLIQHFMNGKVEYSIVVRRLQYNTETGGYRAELRKAWKSGHTNFVLDCNIENLPRILKHAQQIGLMTSVHKYIITNLDMHTIDLKPYKFSYTNITGVRIVNPESEVVKVLSDYIFDAENGTSANKLRIKAALMADALSVYAEVLKKLPYVYSKRLSCDSTKTWRHGLTVINYMREVVLEDGLTGTVKFNKEGTRTEFSLEILELRESGIVKAGDWNPGKGPRFSRPPPENEAILKEISLRYANLTVIITLTEPYGMIKDSQLSLQGNNRYEGFGVDLIQKLSNMTGFNYTFIVREDSSNGVKNKETGKWSGMIGDVMDDKAQLAITDLTITSERQDAVDFTAPFMSLGISILYKKPMKSPPSFFAFATPYATEVWVCIAVAYFLVSISFFVLGRLCPSEWINPYPCVEEPEYLMSQFSLRNSFWFTIGSIMQQGSEIAPIAYATRMLAGMWWFFTLIMVSSYTANLSAFLAKESPNIPFNDVNELVERAGKFGVTYGAKSDGATANFFRDSDKEIYRNIYAYMTDNSEKVMVSDNKYGVIKAEDENENYAFFMESTSIEYEVERHCTLQQVGGMLDEKGYGIAMRKGSPYRNELNTALLALRGSGVIADLKRKWWKERRGGGQCGEAAEASATTPLNLTHVGGVFYVTVFGIIAAVLLVFFEMALHLMKLSVRYKTSFRDDLKEELKFYFRFKGLVKSMNNQRTNANSPTDSEITERVKPRRPVGFVPDVACLELT